MAIKIVVIGYGAIGRMVVEELGKLDSSVSVCGVAAPTYPGLIFDESTQEFEGTVLEFTGPGTSDCAGGRLLKGAGEAGDGGVNDDGGGNTAPEAEAEAAEAEAEAAAAEAAAEEAARKKAEEAAAMKVAKQEAAGARMLRYIPLQLQLQLLEYSTIHSGRRPRGRRRGRSPT